MELFNQDKIYDFMGKNKVIFSISSVLMAIALYLILVPGFKYGVDFAGGTIVQVKYNQPPDASKIKDILLANDFKNLEVQNFGSVDELLIRFATSSTGVTQDISDKIRDLLADTGAFEIRRVEMIGPKVGAELREKGMMAALISMAGILIYMAFRFEWRFGLAAVIGLLHDVIITAGCVIVAGVDFDLTVLAALLMLMGHSINDTIVIFDRIRETVKHARPDKINGGYNFAHIINEAVSKTLSRTTLTVVTVFFVILTLYLFGGEIINGFAFTMLIGTIIGAFSSIFIASPFVLWTGYDVAKAKAKEAAKEQTEREKEKMRSQFEKGVV
jgi:preprotein translocase subunit SecF